MRGFGRVDLEGLMARRGMLTGISGGAAEAHVAWCSEWQEVSCSTLRARAGACRIESYAAVMIPRAENTHVALPPRLISRVSALISSIGHETLNCAIARSAAPLARASASIADETCCATRRGRGPLSNGP